MKIKLIFSVIFILMLMFSDVHATVGQCYGYPQVGGSWGLYDATTNAHREMKVDTNGKQYINTVDTVTTISGVDTISVVDTINTVSSVTDIAGGDIDTVSVVDTVNTVTGVTNVTSVDTIDTISVLDTVNTLTDITGGDIDTVSVVDIVNTVTAVTNIASMDLVDTLSVVDTINTVSAVDTISVVDTVNTVTSVTNIAAGTIDVDYLTESFLTEVARGNISGVNLYNIVSFNDTLATDAVELIAPQSYADVNATSSVYISSSSATDDKDSTGILTLTITGINDSNLITNETISLEGQTTVETTESYSYILSAKAATEGASGQVGDIYIHKQSAITGGVPDDATATFLKIPIGYGSMSAGKFQIPTGDTGVLVDVTVTANGTGPYVITCYNKKSGAAKNTLGVWTLNGSEKISMNVPLEALEYIYFGAISANANDDVAIRARVLVY